MTALNGTAIGETLTGGMTNDVISGLGGADSLLGDLGSDTLDGGIGDDTLRAGDGSDLLLGGDGNDLLDAHTGDDTLDGGAGNDSLSGGNGNDVLYGGIGDDTLDGGFETDTASYYYATGGVTVSLANPALQDTGGDGWDLLSNIENLAGSTAHDRLTGDDYANVIHGNGGGDELAGNGGNDSLVGGIGVDTIYGGAGADTLEGGDGNDILDGGTGPDSMTGGLGSDTYYVDDVDDYVVEGEEINTDDVVVSSLPDYTLPANVEHGHINPAVTGAANITGNGLGNIIHAGFGNNIMDGGDANDLVSYRYGASAAVKVNLSLEGDQDTGGSGLDRLISIENLLGSDYNDTLTGNASSNDLDGWSGNDTLDGGLGNDTLTGNGGIDTFAFTTLLSSESNVDLIITFDANAEKIALDAPIFAAFTQTGALAANRLRLSTDAETLDAVLIYNSTMAGGAQLSYDADASGPGLAIPFARFDAAPALTAANFVITAPNLNLVDAPASAANMAGGAGNDTLAGLDGNDTLNGYAGNDQLHGGDGNDTLDGGLGDDIIDGGSEIAFGGDWLKFSGITANLTVDLSIGTAQNTGAGSDTITNIEHVDGSVGNDKLTGNSLANELRGGDGADTLSGGLGNDTLYGGSGADSYVFDTAPDASSNKDLITGFLPGSDRIVLKNNVFDAANLTGQLPSINFLAGPAVVAATGASHYFIYNSTTGDLYVDADGSGSAHSPILFATLGASVALTASDIYLEAVAGNTVNGTGNGDSLTATAGNDTLLGQAGNDTLHGGAGHDQLYGGDGNDALYGGSGADTMEGGAGNDSYVYDHIGDVITESDSDTVTGGYDHVSVQLLTYTLGNNIESATITHSLAASLYGNALDNNLGAGGGDNTIDGGAGIDTVYFSGAGSAGVSVNLGEGSGGRSGSTYTLSNIENINATSFADTLTGDELANHLFGAGGNDSLSGGAGNDTLDGGDGNDTLDGGLGDDIIDGAPGEDELRFNTFETPITVDLNVGTSQNTGAGMDTITNVEHLYGGKGNDSFIGNSLANRLDGSQGNDTLRGGAGNDTLLGDAGADSLIGGAGSDSLVGGDGNDSFRFESELLAIDVVADFASGDKIELDNAIFQALTVPGTLSADNFRFGPGVTTAGAGQVDDFIIYNSSTGALYYDADGSEGGLAPVHFATLSNLPTLGAADFLVFGVTGMLLNGNESDDWLVGGAGPDTLNGGAGDDELWADAGADVLEGGDGNDYLWGGSGADTMTGGNGNDTYVVEDAGDVVIENSSNPLVGGFDTVFLYLQAESYHLPENVENLFINHSGSIDIYGNNLSNYLQATLGDNYISGGYQGFDTVVYSSEGAATAGINASLLTGLVTGGSGNDTLHDIDSIVATEFNDTLTGNDHVNHFDGQGGNDSIVAGGGDDFIFESSGNDYIDGGDGNDTLYYYYLDGGLTINLGLTGPYDTGAGTDTIINIENVHGGDYGDQLIGNAANNQLMGGSGNDTLSGGAGDDYLDGGEGADSMVGGSGNDNYQVDDALDVIVEEADGGRDHVTVYLPGATYTLPAGVEGASILASEDGSHLIGNGLDNFLGAGTGDNSITGGLGSDSVSFFNGVIDSLEGMGVSASLVTGLATGASGNDTLISIEHLYGSVLNDSLTGDGADNRLDGNLGDDTLIGGAGNDYLMDSGGNDVFDGGEGSDAVSYQNVTYPVNVNLLYGEQVNPGGAGYDSFTSIERLYGSQYGDTLVGDANANVLGGGDGNDILDGGNGHDTLYGDAGDDTLTGGLGSDVFAFHNTFSGELGVDTILDFGNGADRIMLDNNIFTALTGVGPLSNFATRFRSGAGFNSAADADDFLIYDTSTGKLYYDADGHASGAVPVHFLTLAAVASVIPTLTAANIDVSGASGNTTTTGGIGNDTLNGDANNNTLSGLGGNDVLNGFAGNDTLDGGTGADTMTGGDGSDHYYVDDAGDVVIESGNDTMHGSFDRVISFLPSYTLLPYFEEGQIGSTGPADISGNDLNNLLHAGKGNNVINGGLGNDTVSYFFGANGAGVSVSLALSGSQPTINSGSDTLIDIENLFGSEFNDTLIGNAGNNHLNGNGGNDSLQGGDGDDTFSDTTGDDTFNGGLGNDTLSFNFSTAAINANLAFGNATGAGADTLISIEHLYGGKGNDTLTGNSVGNLLLGNDGADSLVGGDGNDTLDGGNGNDTLEGGEDADRFNFSTSLSGNIDTITDFEVGYDKLVLSSNIFAALRSPGQLGLLEANLLYVTNQPEPSAQNASQYLIYDISNGKLYYDADATDQAHGPVHFATLSSAPLIGVEDIDIGYIFNIKGGSSSAESILGGTGDDSLAGFGGNDTLIGGLGSDILKGGQGNDYLEGGVTVGDTAMDTGTDTASYEDAPGNASVQLLWSRARDGGGGNDTLSNIEHLQGGFGNDILAGNDAANVIKGGDGNDVIYGHDGDDTLLGDGHDDWIRGGAGNDYIDGGLGDDTADYSQSPYGVDVNLKYGYAFGSEGDDDTLVSIEDVLGSAHHDELHGSEVDNLLQGGKGNDTLWGDAGDDVLVGGAGNDSLTGGAGYDTLMGGRGADVFDIDSNDGVDEILDFMTGEDTLRIDEWFWGNLPSEVNTTHFIEGSAAVTANQVLVYDRSGEDGMLYYDSDGSGTSAKVLIVTLTGAPFLSPDDIAVYLGNYSAA